MDGVDILGLEAGHRLEQRQTERVHIDPGVGSRHTLSEQHFRWHVEKRPCIAIGYAEISELDRPILGEEDVLRLDVVVNDTLPVNEGERVAKLQPPSEGLLCGTAARDAQAIVQTSAGTELHRQVEATLIGEVVVERHHMRMIELRQRPHFPEEIAVVAFLWSTEHLDRDFSIGDHLVVSQEHLTEAAASKLSGDQILTVQSNADRDHDPTRTPAARPSSQAVPAPARS